MRLKKDSTDQKLKGAYYTPIPLANAMVRLFSDIETKTVLEPSCGDGVFLDSIFKQGCLPKLESLVAVEFEKTECDKISERYSTNQKVEILHKDFFEFYKCNYKKQSYDLIIGNPPYIRYQYLKEKQRNIQSEILTSHGMKSNKLINAWVGFLVACVQMLSENGKIAFVVPAEILQVVYAEDLRLFLAKQLKRITLITFEKLIFPEIEQEVLVIFGEKGGTETGIRIIEMDDLSGLASLKLDKNGFKKLQIAKEKWTKYFTSPDEIDIIQTIKSDSRFVKFSDYGIINVGITTGNNDYFSVDCKTADEYDLSSVLLPLIGRSSHAHGIYFTYNDWQINVSNEKKAQLINFRDIPFEDYPDKHQKYIQKGEVEGQQNGYKCSIRDKWYIIPSIWVPDAFFLRRNNLYPKFVLNRCNAVSTDTMHRMKFFDSVDPENVLLSYYNSISFAFTEICGRSYGGGVLEILPGEMGNIMLPKIIAIDSNLKKSLLSQIYEIVRGKHDIEIALDMVDQKLLVEYLGIESELCQQCRIVWKKLQKRRLGRS